MKKVFFRRSSLLLFSFLFICGCGHGKIGSSPIEPVQVDNFIEENHARFHVAYSGEWNSPGSIRFDLKDDKIVLTGDGWHPVEKKSEVLGLVGRMNHVYRRYRGVIGALGPQLFLIQDKNDLTIGYLYTPFDLLSSTPVRPDGENYKVDAITELDTRDEVYRGRSGSRRRRSQTSP
jgi:hypothetical protein